MKWLSGPNVRVAAVAASVAAVTALAIGAPAIAQGSAPVASPGSPFIVAGVGSHTVFLNTGNYQTLGKLHLARGAWTVFAKAAVEGQTVLLHCRLTAGGDSDQVSPQIDGTTVPDQEVVLNVTHVFGSAGTVTFACNSSGVSVAAFSIKITAIKAGTLTKVRL